MSIEFDNNLPIYLQIMQYIKRQIVTGTLKAGDKIPSVRELAAELQINPNTVQRTFQELEREEVVETKRGLGRYVTSEESKIMTIKKEMAGELLERFLTGMQELGIEEQDIVNIVADAVAEGKQSLHRDGIGGTVNE
ncbi:MULTISPECIES: GntR family transcriptional regulator [unclassified Paenibacillus]|uniref:GntR family transcriptional regulator n=1 Tax=unclassified Paenibacillus TaxID=185978 RepID=UPI0007E4C786|nr:MULTISPECIES: GntR family transcriptional regulator [unclassified Paenibacillus]OAX50704.1 HTH-type transcriptional repressor YtrA [Paenibacillus sp. AD87]SEK86590.1 transcriptional regulator, GntR family [Paenibacillus sp. OK003]SLK02378.1 transcriptional regulator, GntR family [Paenibacillus sp. RU5A]SOC68948.1 transcriptional regulator, GntR family [Paenibacillus sp. RU26A]SOC71395.1 transcriptional regulator, GntR family [Paenibacillus sp. RU5M]